MVRSRTAAPVVRNGSDRDGADRRCRAWNLLGVLFLDPLTDAVAHVASDLDRSSGLALSFFHCLRHAPFRRVDEGLIKQTDLLVEGLEPRFDDLVDHIR